MLLRRFSKHVTDQNWIAVWLDVVVVVVGIFLGMQVTEWNDARKEMAKESIYLDRLALDLEQSIKLQNKEIEIAKFVLEQIHNLDNLLSSTISDPINMKKARRNIQTVVLQRPLRLDIGTLNELNSTGRLNLISDHNLRKQLNFLVENFKRDQMVVSAQRQNIMPIIHEFTMRFSRPITADGEQPFESKIDITALRSELLFKNKLQALYWVADSYWRHHKEQREYSVETINMINEIRGL